MIRLLTFIPSSVARSPPEKGIEMAKRYFVKIQYGRIHVFGKTTVEFSIYMF